MILGNNLNYAVHISEIVKNICGESDSIMGPFGYDPIDILKNCRSTQKEAEFIDPTSMHFGYFIF